MRTNTDITIYTRGLSTGAETWTRSTVLGVAWNNRKAANVLKSGLLEADSVAVYIPMSRGALTLKVGDILVKGVVTDVIGPSFTITALKAKYPDVVVIKSVDRMDMGSAAMHHWQIGAS